MASHVAPAREVLPDLVSKATRKKTGEWKLTTTSEAKPARRSGRYTFDSKTLKLKDETDQVVGRIIVQHIAAGRLQWKFEQKPQPVVRVLSSEVMEEIQNPSNANAFFVLPSQLNGAEYPSPVHPVHLIDAYKFDRTAGPRGQLALHPAVGQFLLDNAAKQGAPRGFNAVDDLLTRVNAKHELEHAQQFRSENGYFKVPKVCSKQLVSSLEKELGCLKTIAAMHVPATGLDPTLSRWSDQSHVVNMVYASAVPVNAYNNQLLSEGKALKSQEAVAAILLRGAYYGAIRLALEYYAQQTSPSRIKVFLMPVGGGVFNNSMSSIARCISEAIELSAVLCPPEQLVDRLDLCVLTWNGKPEESENFKSLLGDLGLLSSGRGESEQNDDPAPSMPMPPKQPASSRKVRLQSDGPPAKRSRQ